MPSSHFRLTPPLVRAPQTRSSPGRSWTRSWTPRQGLRPLDHPGYTASIPSLSKIISPETLSKCICSFRLPVHSLFTLKDQFIAFAGSIHVVIMDIKKKEQHVVFIYVSMISSYSFPLQILEGHRNNISCLARSHSGSYLASGDTGPDQHSVLVWSVISKRPVLRMTSPHGAHGVESVQFTCDDKWLVTVGGSHSNQSVCVWDWKNSPGIK